MHKKWTKTIGTITEIMEAIIAVIIGITVLLGVLDLVGYTKLIFLANPADAYRYLNEFLRHALLLVVGIELIIMISTHSHESILTLVLFVIARKMLVYADSMMDIFIGTLSIALIFFVLKRALADEKVLATMDNTFSAALPINKLNVEYGFNFPEDISHTLGGLVYAIANDEDLPIEEGTMIKFNNLQLEIVGETEGVIERVGIHS